ncbi:hypothetical protein [Rossellomorea aquimaris]|nr:hypothetical protein [Rossellomorea aquimaris]
MDYGLLAIGVALLLISYLVGVKKLTWLLAGFNDNGLPILSSFGVAWDR